MPFLRAALAGVIVVGALSLPTLRLEAKSYGLNDPAARDLTITGIPGAQATTGESQTPEDLLSGDYGSSVAVPEPATLVLVGIGLCAIGRLRRRPRHLNTR